ncbi:hypothetical protein ZWY2020_015389 [Hordeum vulgare]|nr:hypothetical protein ZWY2020_015389 [Hordeum vulgare]
MPLTIAVASVVIFVRPIALFFISSPAGFGLYIFLIILPFINTSPSLLLCPLYYYYYQRHLVNLLLLALFTVAISFAVGLTCAFTKGEVILESAILTLVVVVVSLRAYTFPAASHGHDFNFLGPFLFAAVMILMVFALMAFFPLCRIPLMVYGGLARGARLLRLHHLRHRQPHQALLLRRVRLGRRRALPRRHQPLPLPAHPLQGIRFLKCLSCLHQPPAIA